jgi:hypothetical protein
VKRNRLTIIASYAWLISLMIWAILGPAPVALAVMFRGYWWGIPAALVVLAGFLLYLRSFYRFFNRENTRFRDDARQRYRRIFRVVALPSDKRSISKPWGAEIKVGHYGWEAQPLRRNDLIYLQGLTEHWLVVWHAGFRPDEIEYVGPKALSQYDWRDFEWVEGNSYDAIFGKPCKLKTPCPFPVRPRPRLCAAGFPRWDGT